MAVKSVILVYTKNICTIIRQGFLNDSSAKFAEKHRLGHKFNKMKCSY